MANDTTMGRPVVRLPCFGTAAFDDRPGSGSDCIGCQDRVACSRVDSKGVGAAWMPQGPGTIPHPSSFARRLAEAEAKIKGASDGSTAHYYELPPGAAQLQDLIAYRNMNGQDAEIFRALYRKGHCPHSSLLREAKKVLFYAQAEVDRLEKYGEGA